MATLGPDSRPHPQLASGSVQSNLGSQNNMPLNRGLERAFEEAANSGFLNLSARKLKEFPSSAANHDLTDTVEADLSRNRLTDIPMEVCQLVSLETLNLYHNCVKTIPDAIVNLQTLTSLNLSRNQLSALPACVCGLPLRVLNASNNKLGSLPEALGQLSGLMELDVSCNELTALPRHIGRLKALRELNVRRNQLCILPEDLAELPLVKFDFSCNKVSSIPICYRKMVQLQSLQLENNPLQNPPAQICTKGKVHIFKYLTMEACRHDKGSELLYLPAMERLNLPRPAAGSIEDIDQNKKHDTDSGVGSDNGDKRLSTTEPSDEDSLSLSAPMSHITEEDGLSKDDSSEHISALTADPVRPSSGRSIENLTKRHGYEDPSLSSPFITYIKDRAAGFDEPLRIEEDPSWAAQRMSKVTEESHFGMISQLREAVELLQHPNRVTMESAELSEVQLYPVKMVMLEESFNGQDCENGQVTPKSEISDGGLEFQKKRELILERTRLEAQLACRQFERHVSHQMHSGDQNENQQDHVDTGEDKSSASSTPVNSPPFGLKPRSVFMRNSKSLETLDPQFTIRRKMEQLREEMELTEQLRENIESRLKMSLPEDLGSSLMDGVVLCHLVNHIRPRAVASIHVPSPAVPKLSMAKCRRNVENFLDACRKLGVPESALCSAYDILQGDVRPVRKSVRALVALDTDKESKTESEPVGVDAPASPAPQAPPTGWRIWDWISSSLLHVFCLVLLFVAYNWSELK
ncbi:leucine-rich repeat and calponin homology domain-containing protein 1 isoform X2 [Paramormyrops kingsleyae]|uniref:Leucine rich repeats and calponin homology domain containing 1 n=1 Tax=Paramormyrops kingsleyae TaxID=1676925 RepID=A0A3B3Q7F3_9TELE|nr:leucine-rich repeat and calponin homology domain-containing protein 1 isoform X2 [Paramormyrops kingsleyae]